MQVTIRLAKLEDMASVHKLVRELAEYEKEPHEVNTNPAIYESDYKEGKFVCHVAEKRGEIVGIALHFPIYSTWKGLIHYLDDLVITSDERRSGLGQLLFDAVRDYARVQGAAYLKWQVLDWNEPAIKFYEKNNATIMTHWWDGRIEL